MAISQIFYSRKIGLTSEGGGAMGWKVSLDDINMEVSAYIASASKREMAAFTAHMCGMWLF